MNKYELINAIAEKANTTHSAAGRALEATLETITETLRDGDSVTLVGFGTFEVRDRAARVGRNPKTGEKINIKATKAPAFKAGKAFKKEVNAEAAFSAQV